MCSGPPNTFAASAYCATSRGGPLPFGGGGLGAANPFPRARVLRHNRGRLPPPATADHDRDARARQRLRRVEQAGRVVVGAVVPALAPELALEHLLRDL